MLDVNDRVVFDIDNDGDRDAFVAVNGGFPSLLYKNNGNGNYSDDPITKFGASWYYRTSDDLEDFWATGSGILKDGGGGTTEKPRAFEARKRDAVR